MAKEQPAAGEMEQVRSEPGARMSNGNLLEVWRIGAFLVCVSTQSPWDLRLEGMYVWRLQEPEDEL